jgi:hypothetical protein
VECRRDNSSPCFSNKTDDAAAGKSEDRCLLPEKFPARAVTAMQGIDCGSA